MADLLTAAEGAALAEHEAVIERGIKTFYEVGIALADIRDRRLYRADYGTFEEYAQKRWQMTGSRAYQMIDAAHVVSTIVEADLPAPANEGQTRELGRVPESERAAVWAETVERTAGKPTAAAVRETYEERQSSPEHEHPSDADMFAGGDWVQPEGPGFEAAVTPPPKPKRAPLDKSFMNARIELEKAASRLGSITNDDRFARNRQMVHGQMTELMISLEQVANLINAADLPSREEETLRTFWAERLQTIGRTLTGIADRLN